MGDREREVARDKMGVGVKKLARFGISLDEKGCWSQQEKVEGSMRDGRVGQTRAASFSGEAAD